MAFSSSSPPERLKGILAVTILKANNLVDGDWFGKNDCYAVVSIEPIPIEMEMKTEDRAQQTETYQRTQIRDGSHPIFNEKFIFPVPNELERLYVQIWDSDNGKDDLLAYGAWNIMDDKEGGLYDTSLDKEWLYVITLPMISEKGDHGGTVDLVVHFIPETLAAYMGKRFDAAQAELKKKLAQVVVAKMTDVASDKIRGYVGIEV